jgi:hypothetical protein
LEVDNVDKHEFVGRTTLRMQFVQICANFAFRILDGHAGHNANAELAYDFLRNDRLGAGARKSALNACFV